MLFCCLQNLLKINFFEKFFGCQTVRIQIRPDILLGLIWVQIVCKGYQQATLEGKELMCILVKIAGSFLLIVEFWEKELLFECCVSVVWALCECCLSFKFCGLDVTLSTTVLPAKRYSDIMFCLQSYQSFMIDRSSDLSIHFSASGMYKLMFYLIIVNKR